MLYSIDLLDNQKQKGTPIGDHIDRVGQFFLRDSVVIWGFQKYKTPVYL